MAVKLMGVSGSRLLPEDGELTQDFLMINQPVFAFANVEDYDTLSRIILEDNENPKRFFDERIRRTPEGKPVMSDPTTQRAVRTAGIIERITNSKPSAYQPPPLSPLDNSYFGAAPFLFGEDRVMRFSAKPVSPVLGDVAEFVKSPNYLREALQKRLTEGEEIEFEFQVQVRSAESLAGAIEAEIEDACVDWDEEKHPFVTVARIFIPPKIAPRLSGRSYAKDLASRHGTGFLNIALLVASIVSGVRCTRPQCALELSRQSIARRSTRHTSLQCV